MSGFVQLSKAAFCAWLLSTGAVFAETTPQRVVSINLCTDQLLLTVADGRQILSLSSMSHDPKVSPMASAALAYPINHANAEEIFRLAPDLVLASEYSSPTTLSLLRRLGLRVETFPVEASFDDLKANVHRAGQLLGQDQKAALLLAEFEEREAHLRQRPSDKRVVIYGPNGFASKGGLWQEILDVAGFKNAVDDILPTSGTLPLEALVMLAPDFVITGAPYAGASRAEEILTHPSLAHLNILSLAESEWSCGSLSVLNAAERLQQESQ